MEYYRKKCKKCNYVDFFGPVSMQRHEWQYHLSVAEMRNNNFCGICGKRFENRIDYTEHMEWHDIDSETDAEVFNINNFREQCVVTYKPEEMLSNENLTEDDIMHQVALFEKTLIQKLNPSTSIPNIPHVNVKKEKVVKTEPKVKVAKTEPKVKVEVAKTEPKVNVEVAKTEPKVNVEVAKTEPKVNVEVAKTEPKVNVKVAKTEPKVNVEVAKTEPKVNVEVAKTEPKVNVEVAKTEPKVRVEVAKTKTEPKVRVEVAKTKTEPKVRVEVAKTEPKVRVEVEKVEPKVKVTPSRSRSPMNLRSSNSKVYTCERCDYATKEQGNYKRHISIHGKKGIPGAGHSRRPRQRKEKEKIKCTFLGCTFETRETGNFSRHMGTHGIPERNKVVNKCHKCEFTAQGHQKLHFHCLRDHSESALHQCEFCFCRFKTSVKLKEHRYSHAVAIKE